MLRTYLTAALLTAQILPAPVASPQLNTVEATSINLQFVTPKPTPDFNRDVLVPLRKAQDEKRIADEKAEAARIEAARVEAARVVPVRVATPVAASPASYANNYTPGQCTWYVASRISVPASMGNATNWSYGLASAGWTQTGPVPGAIGVSHAGYAGHVVIVNGVVGAMVSFTEMNGPGGPFVVDTRLAPISDFQYYVR